MAQTITTPGGETLVVLPLDEFEALRDATDHAKAMAALARGDEERLSPAEALELAEAATPLAFWRRKRGLTQAALAERAGASQGAIADMERGARVGTVGVLKRVAAALDVRIEDLVAEE